MKRIAVYPGTFDPVTNGHIDLVERSLTIFDEVVVAVAANPKKAPLFSLEERVAMFKEVTAKYRNVAIEGFDGLLVDYVKRKGAVRRAKLYYLRARSGKSARIREKTGPAAEAQADYRQQNNHNPVSA